MLGNNDIIIINNIIEFSYSVFDRLRSREWLNCWDITATLEITDRPVFMRLGLSVLFYKKDKNSGVMPVSNPLRY
jgi:hypothetical protein